MPRVESALHTLIADGEGRRSDVLPRVESSMRCPHCPWRISRVTAVVNVILLLYSKKRVAGASRSLQKMSIDPKIIELTADILRTKKNKRVYSNLGRNPDTCIVCCTVLPTQCERLDRTSYTPSRRKHDDINRTLAAVLIRDTWYHT